jgi:L-iditol 2-dehydrogenase
MDVPDTMKAARLYAPGDLRIEEVSVPEPASDEVLIRIDTNGICGSDIHFFERGELGPFKVTKPYSPGHEACGVVVAVGSDIKGVDEGTRVAVEPGIPCRRCELCKKGRYNLCEDVVFMSAPPIDGTFQEYVVVPADFVFPLPDCMDNEDGAFVEPVAVAVQACERGGLRAGESVTVIGGGPIGLVTALTCRAYGVSDVIVVEGLSNRIAYARDLGFTNTIDYTVSDPVRQVANLTDGRMTDVVFDASGSSAGCSSAPHLAARGGRVVSIGWPETDSVAYPIAVVMEKELDLRGVNRYCNAYPKAIALLGSGILETAPLVSHRFPFANVVEAFEFASSNKRETMKVMVAHGV